MPQKQEVIYVAGPLTSSGLLWHNIRNVVKSANIILQKGHIPIIPHLTFIWAMTTEFAASLPESVWLDWGLKVLERCDSLYREPGISRGTDGEVAHAVKLGQRVYLTLDEIPDITEGAGAAPSRDLHQAIQHCLELAQKLEGGEEHTQMASWLRELEQLRAEKANA